ncbi:unnamed protein product [Prorocentrum cordatum]|uniref:Hsp90 chaperone protein kinase-targeting subunit n=1 Tax=Prorocentrum cordatum TaxID=2364126 RepID=A0ABN9TB99_9DINO|nr:unnamed protein product [Polarella glacialis]
MTNYNKWDKFAADLASDTEEEEDQELQESSPGSPPDTSTFPRASSRKSGSCARCWKRTRRGLRGPGLGGRGPAERGRRRHGAWRRLRAEEVQLVLRGLAVCPRLRVHQPRRRPVAGFFRRQLPVDAEGAKPRRALAHRSCLPGQLRGRVHGPEDQGGGTGRDRPISRKEVADLIMRRQQGGDAEKINLEHEKNRESMKLFEKLGAETVELKGPEA